MRRRRSLASSSSQQELNYSPETLRNTPLQVETTTDERALRQTLLSLHGHPSPSDIARNSAHYASELLAPHLRSNTEVRTFDVQQAFTQQRSPTAAHRIHYPTERDHGDRAAQRRLALRFEAHHRAQRGYLRRLLRQQRSREATTSEASTAISSGSSPPQSSLILYVDDAILTSPISNEVSGESSRE